MITLGMNSSIAMMSEVVFWGPLEEASLAAHIFPLISGEFWGKVVGVFVWNWYKY
jgi:hypothetical protein